MQEQKQKELEAASAEQRQQEIEEAQLRSLPRVCDRLVKTNVYRSEMLTITIEVVGPHPRTRPVFVLRWDNKKSQPLYQLPRCSSISAER